MNVSNIDLDNIENEDDKGTWLSIYFYHPEPLDSFIARFIKPLTDDLILKKVIKHFFFIRYWEGGSHVRLRLYFINSIISEVGKEHIKSFFDIYVKDSIFSSDGTSEFVISSKSDEPEIALKMIQSEYVPEIERYGGNYAIKLAEQHFFHSSDTVLKILEENNDWTYSTALGSAVKLQMSFAFAAGMTTSEAKDFFNWIYSCWFPRSYMSFVGQDTSFNDKIKDEVLDAFENNYNTQKGTLISFCEKYWGAMSRGTEFDQYWINDWIEKTTILIRELHVLEKENKITYPIWYANKEPVKKIWLLYISYVHMTCNRLGVLNHDEGYLGYILKRCFQEISLQKDSNY